MREPHQLSSASHNSPLEPQLAPESLDAFEAAAAQVRASWEELDPTQPEAHDEDPFAASALVAASRAPAAPAFAVAPAPVFAGPPVTVSRAPSASAAEPVSFAHRARPAASRPAVASPATFYEESDDAPSLPRPKRSIWLFAGAALALVGAGAWLAASGGGGAAKQPVAAEAPEPPPQHAPVLSAQHASAPESAPAPAPSAPVAPEVPEAPAVAAPVAPAPEPRMEPVAVRAAPEPSLHAASHTEPSRKKRSARPARTARPAPEPSRQATAPARVTREPARASKGTGFVTANPY